MRRHCSICGKQVEATVLMFLVPKPFPTRRNCTLCFENSMVATFHRWLTGFANVIRQRPLWSDNFVDGRANSCWKRELAFPRLNIGVRTRNRQVFLYGVPHATLTILTFASSQFSFLSIENQAVLLNAVLPQLRYSLGNNCQCSEMHLMFAIFLE